MNSRLKELEDTAIHYLKAFEPSDGSGYWLGYSGGKDSDCIKILATVADVKFEAHHNLTTVDAPETVRYIKSQKDVIIDRPEKSMWQLIPEKLMPPTRLVRYCCAVLKERGGEKRLKLLGVRKAESTNRRKNAGLVQLITKPKSTIKLAEDLSADYAVTEKGNVILNMDNGSERRLVESCYRTRTTMVNPIIDWTDDDVWDYLHYYGCESNPLYQCGKRRVGCVMCPLARQNDREDDERRYPKYKALYIRAFERMLDERKKRNRSNFKNSDWKNGEEVFDWWMQRIHGQMTLDDFLPDGFVSEPDYAYLQ